MAAVADPRWQHQCIASLNPLDWAGRAAKLDVSPAACGDEGFVRVGVIVMKI